MLNGLFLNTEKARCSIHESGLMVYNALVSSDKYHLDYMEIGPEHRTFRDKYDFLVFNYHPFVMGWLDTTQVKKLPGVKITFVLETLPNNPFPMCPKNDFDLYCVLDPSMKIDDERVYPFPRPLESPYTGTYQKNEIPTIGTFGFATAGKGFEKVVLAVDAEFDRAIIRMNIPMASYITAKKTILPASPSYADTLVERCMNLARDGIELKITHDYMSKAQLIEWCAANDLNVFLYNRNQPGLSATTDQAISSGRPLAVSDNETFRHIHQYIKPYPSRSLKESIAQSTSEVLQMRDDWRRGNFVKKFESMLSRELIPKRYKYSESITLGKKGTIENFIHRNMQRLSFFCNPVDEHIPNLDSNGKNVLFVSPKDRQCGMYQYGRNIFNSLRKSKNYRFSFCECGNGRELAAAVKFYNPAAIIYNYHPMTMLWLTGWTTRKYKVPQLGIIHEFIRDAPYRWVKKNTFDYELYQDPDIVIKDNPKAFRTKQLVYPYVNTTPLPNVPTIGSFGFGTPGKGFEKLVELVQEEFDVAHIRLHIPFNDVVDVGGEKYALPTAERCWDALYKPQVTLSITHDFLTEPQLLDFLAGNTINAFLYDTRMNVGISGPGLHALAVHRPMAITKCGMFRHLLNTTPSICVEDLSLKEIIANGTKPLERFYKEWSEEEFIKDYERILEKVIG